jgi:sortase (surface protein transpeptidase)
VAVSLVMAGLVAGLVVLGVARMPVASPLLRWLGSGQSHGSSSALSGGPRLAAAGGPPTVTADPGTRAAEKAIAGPTARPSLLLIPKLGVDAVVEAVGVNSDGTMAVPSQPEHVAWYQLGAMPGDPGDALIDGHLDWWTGPAVFWHLASLRPGDQVNVVRVDGSELTFAVDSATSYPWNARTDGLVTTSGAPSISLVTCSGTWDQRRQTYLNRLVVHATLVPTAPQQTPGDEGG